jgi:hypothetical protein
MDEVEIAIRMTLSPGQQLLTYAGRVPFLVGAINDTTLVLLVGKQQSRTVVRWEQLTAALDDLPRYQWIEVGSGYNVVGDPQTLDGALKKHVIKRAIANYLAPVLVRAALAEVDYGRPLRIRLTTGTATVRSPR